MPWPAWSAKGLEKAPPAEVSPETYTKYDPKITTTVIFTGEWSMPVKEAEATNSLADQGIDVFNAAPGQLVIIFVLAAIFGVLAAIWPARRASKLDVLEAISTE